MSKVIRTVTITIEERDDGALLVSTAGEGGKHWSRRRVYEPSWLGYVRTGLLQAIHAEAYVLPPALARILGR